MVDRGATPELIVHRIYLRDGLVIGARVEIPEEESHHLRVRRAGSGDLVELVDGKGAAAAGRLQHEGRRWLAVVEQMTRTPEPPPTRLLVAAGDKDRFGWLIEKAVETGVTAVVPLETERSRDVASRIRAGHLDKLERRASEALKQSGGRWMPAIAEPVELAEGIGSLEPGARWLADQAGGPAPRLSANEPVTIAIGPEGGFTGGERDRFAAAGFVPVSFGDRILRFETAAIAGAVIAATRRKESA